MKHPAGSDFHTVVTAAGVNVTFKPTNSTYSFYRFAETGALSLAGIQHAGRDTDDYPSDEVQDMAQQIASGHASVHFGPFQDEEEVNRFHWEDFATQAKRETEPTTISESIVGAAVISDSAHKAASDLRMLARSKNGWRSFAKSVASSQNATASIAPSTKSNFHQRAKG